MVSSSELKAVKHVVMIGPDLDRMGGVGIFAQTLMNADSLSNVQIDYVGTVGNGSKFQRVYQMLRGQAVFLKKLLTGPRPDVFHILVADDLSFYRKLLYFLEARLTGCPIVAHGHFAHLEQLHERSKTDANAIKWFFTRADQVHAITSEMKQNIEDWTEGQANVKLLLNSVSVDDFQYFDRRNNGDPTVLFMGRVGARKGTFDLIESVPKILESVPNAHFLVGGDGDLEALRTRVTELNIQDSVEILGWVEGDRRFDLFAKGDVLCLPSYAEGLPMCILEAMASGLPVVSTNINGIPDAVIDGETGYLIEPGDVESLSDRLIRLLSDTELRHSFGKAARERAENTFDREAQGNTIKSLWAELL